MSLIYLAWLEGRGMIIASLMGRLGPGELQNRLGVLIDFVVRTVAFPIRKMKIRMATLYRTNPSASNA